MARKRASPGRKDQNLQAHSSMEESAWKPAATGQIYHQEASDKDQARIKESVCSLHDVPSYGKGMECRESPAQDIICAETA